MKQIKDLSILTVGHVLQGIILLVSTRVITSLLAPAQMGRFALIYTIAALFFSLFITPVGAYVQRNVLEWKQSNYIRYYSRQYIGYLFISGILAAVIVLPVKYLAKTGIDISDTWAMIVMFGLIAVTYLNSFYCGTLNILQKRLWFVVCSILTLVFGLIASVSLTLSFSRTAEYWISGQIIGQILVAFIAGVLFYKIVKEPNRREAGYQRPPSILADVFHFCWPLSIASIIVWVQSQAYRFLLTDINGIEVVGFFTVGFNLASRLIGEFEALFYKFYDPIFYANIANSTKEKKALAWNQYAKAFFPAMILVCVFIGAGGSLISKLFVAPAFQELAGSTMRWGGLAALFATTTSLYTRVGIAKSEMKGLIGPYTVGAIVVLGGIYILCPINPYIGAGLSLSLSALAILIYLMIEMHRLLPVSFPVRRVGLALGYSLPMFAAFGLSIIVIQNPTIWQSLAILSVSGFYLLFAQMALAKEWINKIESPLIKSIYKAIDGVQKVFTYGKH